MVSKSQIKLIKSLSQKKFRTEHQLFVVEGKKSIEEFLKSGYETSFFFTSEEGLFEAEGAVLIAETELAKITMLKNPQKVLAVFKIPKPASPNFNGLIVALDGVRDPGNLGTIIRLCDWFGVEQIMASDDTVDCYNPKVVQASMGSLGRIKIQYLDLEKIFKVLPVDYPVFGAFLEGENVYKSILPERAVIVMGNEAHGIRENITQFINSPVTIPQFGKNQQTESLNVAMATAVFLSEFRRTGFTGKQN
ncbi:RNA methyltransferase [Christiangramia fulva]|uniref:RNA methyltransferase n=1 Tax=Christiangramia fulva TaxID=2126553 RepID=A0A2R3Z5I0_9FLAO|nr:RNA methyltransferase [Christiangramia fulva]AVR45531.1 RNA methyltransferase [Christiangramia fulva]